MFAEIRKRLPEKVGLNSALLAAFFLEKEMILALDTGVYIPGLSLILTVIFAAALWRTNRGKFDFRAAVRPFCVLAVIGAFLFVSGLINGFGNIMQYMKQFVFFGFWAVVYCTVEVDHKQVLLWVIRFSAVFSVLYMVTLRWFYILLTDFEYGSFQMAVAYNFLPIAIADLTYFINLDRVGREKRDLICGIISSAVSLFALCIDCSTRAAVLGIVIAAAMLIIGRCGLKKTLIITAVSTGSITAVMVNLPALVKGIRWLLRDFGIRIMLLERTNRYMRQGGSLSSRQQLYSAAMEGFLQKPLTGHGVGWFEGKYGTYGHNIFLELLYETGIIIGAFAMYMLFRQIYFDFIVSGIKKQEEDIYLVMFRQLLCLSSLLQLLFSSTFWLSTVIWLYVIYIVKFDEQFGKKIRQKKNRPVQ